MAKIVRLRLTGRAEKFVEQLVRTGLSEREIIAKALWLLEMVSDTDRVALVNSSGQIQYRFTLRTLADLSQAALAAEVSASSA